MSLCANADVGNLTAENHVVSVHQWQKLDTIGCLPQDTAGLSSPPTSSQMQKLLFRGYRLWEPFKVFSMEGPPLRVQAAEKLMNQDASCPLLSCLFFCRFRRAVDVARTGVVFSGDVKGNHDIIGWFVAKPHS